MVSSTLYEDEGLTQSKIRTIRKFGKEGVSAEIISTSLEVDIRQVIQVLFKSRDNDLFSKVIDSYARKKERLSYLRQTLLEAKADQSYAPRVSAPNEAQETYIKEELTMLQSKTLKKLEVRLNVEYIPAEIPKIAAECLADLSFDTEKRRFLKILKVPNLNFLKCLIDNLCILKHKYWLLNLLYEISIRRSLQMASLLLISNLIEKNSPPRLGDEFEAFLNLLCQSELKNETKDLIWKIADYLHPSQLLQVIGALCMYERDDSTHLKINQLRLKVEPISKKFSEYSYGRPHVYRGLRGTFEPGVSPQRKSYNVLEDNL